MSLDFAMLNERGAPFAQVSIGTRTHEDLMGLVEGQPQSLFHRVSDYYGDAEFQPGELPVLLGEVDGLLKRGIADAYLSDFLAALRELVLKAMATGRPLHVLAD